MGEALKDNSTLELLNIESNFVSGEGIVAILEGIDAHKVVEEFRVTNQVGTHSCLSAHSPSALNIFLFLRGVLQNPNPTLLSFRDHRLLV